MKRFLFTLILMAVILVLAGCPSPTDSGSDFSAGQAVTHSANTVSFDLHYVPADTSFTMGEHVETPTKSVTMTISFWMGETEVTQGLWEDVWGSTWPGTDPDGSGSGAGAEYPAYYVSWYDAAAFCNLLTEADGSIADNQQVYYSNTRLSTPYTRDDAAIEAPVFVDWQKRGYRLPTEAEWEYAARYIDGTRWNNGDHASGDLDYACYDPGSGAVSGSLLATDARISEYAWWSGNNGLNGEASGSKAAGQKTVNALELRDMSGNLSEWCYDLWSDAYSGSPETDPAGPPDGDFRVRRGGYWNGSGGDLRCAYRYSDYPHSRKNSIGFRICRTAD